MKRIAIGLTIFIVIILCGGVAYHYHTNWKPFICNGHISANILFKENEKFMLNVDVNIIRPKRDGSELLVIGSLKGNDNNYIVSRKIFLSNMPSDFKGFNKIVITREERHSMDDVPNEIWQQYVLPEAPGVEFYSEVKPLSNHSFLIKGLSNPYFVCTVAE